MNLNKLFAEVFTIIVIVYVAYVMVTNFIQSNPGFAIYGLALIGALAAGAVAHFKYGLFKN